MKYGEKAKVMNYRSVRIGGLFGRLFARDGVEVTGYVSRKIRADAVSQPGDARMEV
jgi:flagellar biosynthesis protein FlhF